MDDFEFIVEGPAVSVWAKKNNSSRYREWIKTVRAAAQKEFPGEILPSKSPDITVSIMNYYSLWPPDVDNIIKPLLDGMETVVYDNDKQVRKVVSERVHLTSANSTQNPSPLLAAALEKYNELLHIIVTWKAED